MAGERVKGAEGAVKVQQDHLVWNGGCVGEIGVGQCRQGGCDGLVVAEAGQQAGFGGSSACRQGENAVAESRNPFASER